jgi:hypothetical protein
MSGALHFSDEDDSAGDEDDEGVEEAFEEVEEAEEEDAEEEDAEEDDDEKHDLKRPKMRKPADNPHKRAGADIFTRWINTFLLRNDGDDLPHVLNKHFWLKAQVSTNVKMKPFVAALTELQDIPSLLKFDATTNILSLVVRPTICSTELITMFYDDSRLESLTEALGATPLTVIAKRPGVQSQLGVGTAAPVLLLQSA